MEIREGYDNLISSSEESRIHAFVGRKFEEIIDPELLRQKPEVIIPRLLGVIFALQDNNNKLLEIVDNLKQEVEKQKQEIENLKQENELLRLKDKKLEDCLKMNSSNSSKPPSSDGYKKPKTKSLRKKSGRSPGGQPGHKGKTLKMSDNPDFIEVHSVEECRHCGSSLKNTSPKKMVKRQVYDIPILRFYVTEHQSEVKVCPCCKDKTLGKFPDNVNSSVQFGSNLKALAATLSHYQFIPYSRLSEFFDDVFHHKVSPGALNKMFGQLYENLEDYENAVKEELKSRDVLGFDETGMRSEGSLHWIHAVSDSDLTYYYIHKNRGCKAMDFIGILPEFYGIAVHDHWNSYYKYACSHALCNAHHLRELKGVIENDSYKWANEVKVLLCKIKDAVYQAKESGLNQLSFLQKMDFTKRYETILKAGFEEYPDEQVNPDAPRKRGRKQKPKSLNLLERLWYNRDEVLRFMEDFRVPFANNGSEQDVRMVKVKQKISGTFRSGEGGPWFCRIRGYISTIRKQKLDVLNSLKNAFDGKPFMPVRC